MVVADVGGTKALLRALAADGSVVAEVLEPTGPGTTGERLDRLVGDVVAEHPTTRAVAVAVPGLVDPEGRVVVSDVLPLLAGWRPRPTAAGAPTVVNDVRAALAAARAAAPDVRDLVVVVVGTGIAAGVVSGGHVLDGADGWAGELGSVPVDLGGRDATTLDDVASGRAVVESVGRPGAEVAALVAAGDPAATDAVARAGAALGRGLATVVTLLNPARVVLAGGTTRYPGYVEAAASAAAGAALAEPWARCELVVDEDPGTLVARGLVALLRDDAATPGQARRGRA